jgi:hypothetical protein
MASRPHLSSSSILIAFRTPQHLAWEPCIALTRHFDPPPSWRLKPWVQLGILVASRRANWPISVILDGDPLADIKNARKVRRVMKNGEMFDLKTLLGED